jgi:hypothetical protein
MPKGEGEQNGERGAAGHRLVGLSQRQRGFVQHVHGTPENGWRLLKNRGADFDQTLTAATAA